MTSALGFEARVDFLLAHFLVCVLFLRFTSGATPANLLMASMVVGCIPYMRLDLPHSKQMRYPFGQRDRLYLRFFSHSTLLSFTVNSENMVHF